MRGDFPTGSVLAETRARRAAGQLAHAGPPRSRPAAEGGPARGRPAPAADRPRLHARAPGGDPAPARGARVVAVRRACEVMTLEDVDYLRLLLIRQRRAAARGPERRLPRPRRGVPPQDRRGRAASRSSSAFSASCAASSASRAWGRAPPDAEILAPGGRRARARSSTRSSSATPTRPLALLDEHLHRASTSWREPPRRCDEAGAVRPARGAGPRPESASFAGPLDVQVERRPRHRRRRRTFRRRPVDRLLRPLADARRLRLPRPRRLLDRSTALECSATPAHPLGARAPRGNARARSRPASPSSATSAAPTRPARRHRRAAYVPGPDAADLGRR